MAHYAPPLLETSPGSVWVRGRNMLFGVHISLVQTNYRWLILFMIRSVGALGAKDSEDWLNFSSEENDWTIYIPGQLWMSRIMSDRSCWCCWPLVFFRLPASGSSVNETDVTSYVLRDGLNYTFYGTTCCRFIGVRSIFTESSAMSVCDSDVLGESSLTWWGVT